MCMLVLEIKGLKGKFNTLVNCHFWAAFKLMNLCMISWNLLMNSGGDDVGAVCIIDDESYM